MTNEMSQLSQLVSSEYGYLRPFSVIVKEKPLSYYQIIKVYEYRNILKVQPSRAVRYFAKCNG